MVKSSKPRCWLCKKTTCVKQGKMRRVQVQVSGGLGDWKNVEKSAFSNEGKEVKWECNRHEPAVE